MSKAFTKENDEQDDAADLADEQAAGTAIPPGSKNYITPAGAARLKAELHQLLYEERPSLVRTVTWAASNGDRSENGDYIYGKKRLREIDRRIRFLSKRLEAIEIIDSSTQNSELVLFGARVTVRDEDSEKIRVFRIVGIDEANAGMGEISWISPMARALLNHRVGEVVTLRTPRGDEDLEIVEIEYPRT
ncbi:transcription elongation factor GreB [Bdellovibrionota bacterium FG-1]